MAFCARGEFLEVQGNKKMLFCARGVRGKSGRRAREVRPPRKGTYSGEVARITLYLFLLPMFIIFTTCSIGTVLSA